MIHLPPERDIPPRRNCRGFPETASAKLWEWPRSWNWGKTRQFSTPPDHQDRCRHGRDLSRNVCPRKGLGHGEPCGIADGPRVFEYARVGIGVVQAADIISVGFIVEPLIGSRGIFGGKSKSCGKEPRSKPLPHPLSCHVVIWCVLPTKMAALT